MGARCHEGLEETTKRGAKTSWDPTHEEDEHGYVVKERHHTTGRRCTSSWAERLQGCFLPGFKPWKSHYNPPPVGLKFIDHGRATWAGRDETWVKFYAEVMGFAAQLLR